eukprot:4527300-Prymnesium_polylepis.1
MHIRRGSESISRGRRTASACVAHAPIQSRTSRVLPTATADPRASEKIVGGRWAHERGLPGM